MLTVVLILVAGVCFVVGLFSPTRARKLEKLAGDKLKPIEDWADQLPKPLNYLVRGPFWLTRRFTQVPAKKGRKAHEKLEK